tara:strand:+ start:233 stop:757 length:525 start_codon:yes stop_codon:yes gene_type:complete
MSKEKLRHATILEALNEYKKTIDSGAMYNEKDVQETIYQIEDLVSNKAIIRNKNHKPKTITGSIYIESYDIYKMYKHFITNVSTPALKTNLQDCSSKTPVYTSVSMKSFDGWSKERKVEEVILHFIDTLDFCIADVHKNFLNTIQTKIENELSRRIAAENATKKILKDNIDENK